MIVVGLVFGLVLSLGAGLLGSDGVGEGDVSTGAVVGGVGDGASVIRYIYTHKYLTTKNASD